MANTKPKTETKNFQAETQRLLELMIHSVYSSKEIFLRELISNASDAIDKLKFEGLTNKALIPANAQFEIRIEIDKEERTLAIMDNGIGMNREELINNIGTIAKSGTYEMLQKMQQDKATNQTDLIGQFGVGFYSVFIVADKVSLITKKAGTSEAIQWESSSGDGTYTITEGSKEEHGTSIILHLKEADPENGLDDFTEFYTLQNIVKKYSDFINYPIMMKEEREEVEKDKDGKPVEGGKKEKIIEDKTINSMQPIWLRPKNKVTEEEYNKFYMHIAHDWTDPLKAIPFHAEGRVEYVALLFIPSRAPFDLFYQTYKTGLKLYVKKVLIQEDFEDMLPTYLRFVKGIIDSPTLPLNLSRELLQKDVHINFIKKGLTNKILSILSEMFKKDKEKYLTFWKEFGQAMKEGISSDFENKDKIMNLLLFPSSFSETELVGFKEYVERMPSNQKSIYYITGESREVAENSPMVETFKEKGFEVFYFVDAIDSFIIQSLSEFGNKKFVSVETGKDELSDDQDKEKKEKELKKQQDSMSNFLETLQKHLDAYVKKVILTDTLVSAPVCIVNDIEAGGAGMNPHLEKMLRRSGQEMPATKRILQLNTKHPTIKKLHERYQTNADDPIVAEYADLLYSYSMIVEGGELKSTASFGKNMASVMEKAL